MTTTQKSILIPALVFGMFSMAAATAATADAAPRRAKHAHAKAYAQAKLKAERKIVREFRKLDKRRNGVLTKADFRVVRYKWVRVGRKWKRKRVRVLLPGYVQILRAADYNHNGVVTRGEYKRSKLASYIREFMPRPRTLVRPYPAPRVYPTKVPPRRVAPPPAPPRPRVTVRDHRRTAPSASAKVVFRAHGSWRF